MQSFFHGVMKQSEMMIWSTLDMFAISYNQSHLRPLVPILVYFACICGTRAFEVVIHRNNPINPYERCPKPATWSLHTGWFKTNFPYIDDSMMTIPNIHGHFRNRFVGGTYHICLAYGKAKGIYDIPCNLYALFLVVQYLNFRYLNGPLTINWIMEISYLPISSSSHRGWTQPPLFHVRTRM